MYYNVYDDNYLAHYGVKGMKWGVRRMSDEVRSSRQGVRDARANLKAARVNRESARIDKRNAYRMYSKTFDQSLKLKNQINPTKSKAYNKKIVETAEASGRADKAYKQTKRDVKSAKRDLREAKRDLREQKTIDKYKKHGLEYNNDTAANVYLHGWKGAKRIEDRIANKKMSRMKAETIETGRSMAKTALLTVGTVSALALTGAAMNAYNRSKTPRLSTTELGPVRLTGKRGKNAYDVLDSTGKVIKKFRR